MFTLPPRRPRLRWIALGYGVVLLLWTSLEDNGVALVTLAGVALMLIAAAFWLRRRFGGRSIAARDALIGAVLIGAVAGAGSAGATAALMLLKVGLHAHVFPDYPFGMIVDMLRRAPVWALAGSLAALGVTLALLARGKG